MDSEYETFRKKIISLQSDLSEFKIDFLDRYAFKDFVERLRFEMNIMTDLCITGYFSETIRSKLEKISGLCKVKLICPELTKSKRDIRNLEALQKLSRVGVEIKFHHRMHARFLVAHNPNAPQFSGLLVIGSFDFNTDGLSLERYDAGIKTRNPDLVKPALKLFETIWNDSSSVPLEKAYPVS